MSPETLLQQFDVMAEAPNGVQKIRELILQLAVRGMLVPQDPSDEPASVLLEQIATEKQRLYKQGKISKPKLLPRISKDQLPYEVPEGWAWARLAELGEFTGGATPSKSKSSYWGGGRPLGLAERHEGRPHRKI
ncbi:MAG TPA: hypothetical protein VGC13_16945 [Longimicrobium sp.]|uniref:hypothetical protein n=1 Tax=Longimicrobium sp. TaxID=2029185 RepID=UPI002ED95C05